jgi:hypothetical protein
LVPSRKKVPTVHRNHLCPVGRLGEDLNGCNVRAQVIAQLDNGTVARNAQDLVDVLM